MPSISVVTIGPMASSPAVCASTPERHDEADHRAKQAEEHEAVTDVPDRCDLDRSVILSAEALIARDWASCRLALEILLHSR